MPDEVSRAAFALAVPWSPELPVSRYLLICGQNTNALARYALMAHGEHLHASMWPAVWPTKEEKPKASAAVVDWGPGHKEVDAEGERI